MKWEDTVLKTQELIFEQPQMKIIEDGKVDLFVTIPLTDMLNKQARVSFLSGIKEYHDLIMHIGESPEEATQKLVDKLVEWGFKPHPGVNK